MRNIDWSGVFLPDESVLEIVARGSAMYIALFFLLRFIVKREAGTLAITDVLVIVLIADAAQNGMSGSYMSVADGVILVLTILGWSYLFDTLAFHFPLWRRLLRPARVQLISRGVKLERNLASEKITDEELMGELRAHGCDRLDHGRAAYIESDGMISVIVDNGSSGAAATKKKSPRGPLEDFTGSQPTTAFIDRCIDRRGARARATRPRSDHAIRRRAADSDARDAHGAVIRSAFRCSTPISFAPVSSESRGMESASHQKSVC